MLALFAREPFAEMRVDVARTAQRRPGFELVFAVALGDLQSGQDLRGLGAPETLYLTQIADTRVRQAPKIAELLHDHPAVIDGAGPRAAGPQQDGKQLRVGERRRAARQQLFPGPVVLRPVRGRTVCRHAVSYNSTRSRPSSRFSRRAA